MSRSWHATRRQENYLFLLRTSYASECSDNTPAHFLSLCRAHPEQQACIGMLTH